MVAAASDHLSSLLFALILRRDKTGRGGPFNADERSVKFPSRERLSYYRALSPREKAGIRNKECFVRDVGIGTLETVRDRPRVIYRLYNS